MKMMKKMSMVLALGLAFTAFCACESDDKTPAAPQGLTKADYAKAYAATADALFVDMETPQPTSAVAPMSYVDSSQTNDRNYYAVGAFVLFLRELYETPDYQMTEDAVHLTATYSMQVEGMTEPVGDLMDVYMQVVRAQDGTLECTLYQTEGGEDSTIIIDVDYDFATNTLQAFNLYMYYSVGEDAMRTHHYYGDGETITILDSDTIDNDYTAAERFASSRAYSIKGLIANAKEIGDFSRQYTDAMVEQAQKVYPEMNIQPVYPEE